MTRAAPALGPPPAAARAAARLNYKAFPPGLGMVKVPMSSARAAWASLSLYAACRPRAVWLHGAALLLVRCFGARVLPGRAVRWTPPMGGERWRELSDRWRRELGGFDELAVAERPQATRTGLALLLLDGGRPRAFLKLRQRGGAGLRAEHAAMRAVWRYGPRSFSVPEPLGTGGVDDWDYLAMAALASPRHRMPRDPPLAAIHAEVGEALASLPREPATPGSWRPMHGDFTPWNLRALPGERLMLFDWEDAAWAPAGADDVLYRASRAALDGRDPGRHDAREAIAYWRARVEARPAESRRERELARALRTALGRMQGGGEPEA